MPVGDPPVGNVSQERGWGSPTAVRAETVRPLPTLGRVNGRAEKARRGSRPASGGLTPAGGVRVDAQRGEGDTSLFSHYLCLSLSKTLLLCVRLYTSIGFCSVDFLSLFSVNVF